MEDLKLIDNEVVPVYITDKGKKVVNGRELHSVLQSKQDFSTWAKKRLNECDAKENKDYVRFHEKMEGNNATMIEYIILLDIAKEMAMLERNAKGKQVRRYFIKVDEKYKEEKSTPLTLQQIQTIAKGTDELYQRVDAVTEDVKNVKEEMESIKNDLPILPLEADKIEKAVRKRGVEVLGGKDSNAYHDRGIRQRVYNSIYGNLKYNFDGVRTYKAIRRKDADRAVQIVNEYKPPLFLADQIENANAQQRLDV